MISAPVPDVIAGGDDIDFGGVQFGADGFGDAEAMRGVLAIDDREIEPQLAPQPRHRGGDRLARATADDVTADQQPHRSLPLTIGETLD